MKWFQILTLVVLIALGGSSQALATSTLVCQGKACGHWSAIRDYQYEALMDSWTDRIVHISTDDGNIANYAGVLTQYWNGTDWVGVPNVSFGIVHTHMLSDPFTLDGQVTEQRTTSEFVLMWSWNFYPINDPNPRFRVGYNNSHTPQDVSWETYHGSSSWTSEVGMGYGPVHGPTTLPVPEPSPLIALTGGLISLMGMARRRRG